jgi:3'-phosphoadenosine 5'-phosphosulfate (PAPS) 3'-phosphatase
MDYLDQLNFLLRQAEKAAGIMMDNFRGSFKAYTKPDNSIVTDVDLAISTMWHQELKKNTQQIGLYSEESPDKSILPNKDYFVVDELDGTSYFAAGQPGFSHQAAFFNHQQGLVVGVLAYPLEQITLYAVKGHGAFKVENGQTTSLNPPPQKSPDSIVYGVPARYQGDKYSLLLNKLAFPPHQILKTNALRTLQMAQGNLDVNIFLLPKIDAWDWAGEKVIIEELGFNHSYLNGNPIHFGVQPPSNNEGYLLCQRHLTSWLVDSIIDK